MKTKTIGFAAILALTSTAAFAGSFQFSVNGGTARIQFDENCSDRVCASVSWQERGSRERTEFKLPEVSTKTISKLIDTPTPKWNADPTEDDNSSAAASDNTAASPAPAEAAPPPAPLAAPPAAVAPVAAPAPVAASQPAPAPAVAVPTPAAAADESTAPAPVRPAAAPVPAPKAPARVAAVAPDPAPAVRPSKPSPVGEWLVEDGEGKIRIEECGANLCGYVSAAKNPNEKDRNNPDPSLRNRPVIGTQILQNMKPSGNRWSGKIYNVKDGKTYTANISLKSDNTLRVEGCAFGGLICGGQNWARAN